MKKQITAIVMCSGLSKRMGLNKLLMDFKGKRMFEYIIDIVNASGFNKIVVVTSYDEIALYAKENTVIYNDKNHLGMSQSIILGVENAGICDGMMFFNCDEPKLDVGTVKRLIDAFDDNDKIIIPKVENNYKNPVLFPIRYKDALLGLSGEAGGSKVYKQNKDDIFEVCFDDGTAFKDIDVPEDFDDFINS